MSELDRGGSKDGGDEEGNEQSRSPAVRPLSL